MVFSGVKSLQKVLGGLGDKDIEIFMRQAFKDLDNIDRRLVVDLFGSIKRKGALKGLTCGYNREDHYLTEMIHGVVSKRTIPDAEKVLMPITRDPGTPEPQRREVGIDIENILR